jgi:hypothetical protein
MPAWIAILPLDPRKSSGSRLDQHASADVKRGDDRSPTHPNIWIETTAPIAARQKSNLD